MTAEQLAYQRKREEQQFEQGYEDASRYLIINDRIHYVYTKPGDSFMTQSYKQGWCQCIEDTRNNYDSLGLELKKDLAGMEWWHMKIK